MPLQDVYAVLELLSKGQESGLRPLEFSNEDLFNPDDQDTEQEINKLLDPDPSIASPRGESPIGSATVELDNDLSKLSHSDSPFQVSLSPAKSTASQPLFKSLMKVAIENVAEAGYLNISDIDSPKQALPKHLRATSQQSGEKTSSSRSKKRSREELDGLNEGRKTKNQVVPTREQSSRYVILNAAITFTENFFTASRISIIGTNTLLFAAVKFNQQIDERAKGFRLLASIRRRSVVFFSFRRHVILSTCILALLKRIDQRNKAVASKLYHC